MAKVNRKHSSIRAFDNPVLERLSRGHPIMPLLCWGPLSIAMVAFGVRLGLNWAPTTLLVGAGFVVWTLTEYLLHRWIFHWQPRKAALRKAFYPVHQLHHDAQEWDRLVAPPLMAVPIWVVFLGLFWASVGSPPIFPFMAGFTIGYLAYDYVHFLTHFGKPRTRIGKGLRRRHLQHHFACPDRWYGVSSPFWDFVFRTHVPKGQRPSGIEAEART